MKLCQYERDEQRAVGLVIEDKGEIVDLAAAWSQLSASAPSALRDYVMPSELLQLIADGDKGRAAAAFVQAAIDAGDGSLPRIALADVHLCAPIARPPKFFAIAVNQDSRRRAITPENPHPTYFVKLHTCITGPFDTVRIPDIGQVGPEIELAVIIGKGGKAISEADAMDHVFGFTVHNDITAHEMRKTTEWVHVRRPDGSEEHLTYPGRYKNFDTFSPMGPWVTTADAVADPHDLSMASYLNGEAVQAGSTKTYVYNLRQLISHLSWAHTLEPGDIISCGTCAPVAPWKSSTIDLGKIGGVLESEIAGLGRLRNPIEFVPGKQNFSGIKEQVAAPVKEVAER
ncbi:fumarylacetoacetate hydrolase family protein [Aquabacter spiritensis]|uniref:2-keto-4-pentenoate hydratase/2-oxohepta-3-ene-1,7-dioic acid hydratase in catechol pathway n=1 Tax=Aquabacter spiritensis TaxID=933073 RepID=A0A4R3LSQ2_9HYPH|nr:fumarylacetoacetate hydrolase family protein [Aquabacter spiritensis]TCT03593.1 2-keto-4-pentenoate hydratase/2-oxohepta-3-ene-1,7-dioic acid hydratase in catechol pathway [Aquabacter spiritensis]